MQPHFRPCILTAALKHCLRQAWWNYAKTRYRSRMLFAIHVISPVCISGCYIISPGRASPSTAAACHWQALFGRIGQGQGKDILESQSEGDHGWSFLLFGILRQGILNSPKSLSYSTRPVFMNWLRENECVAHMQPCRDSLCLVLVWNSVAVPLHRGVKPSLEPEERCMNYTAACLLRTSCSFHLLCSAPAAWRQELTAGTKGHSTDASMSLISPLSCSFVIHFINLRKFIHENTQSKAAFPCIMSARSRSLPLSLWRVSVLMVMTARCRPNGLTTSSWRPNSRWQLLLCHHLLHI